MKKTVILLFITLAAITFAKNSFAQGGKDKKLIQFTGVVMTSDSLMAVPFAHVRIYGTINGTVADAQGYFSLAAQSGDTLRFTAIGFEQAQYVVPYDLKKKKYSIIQLMRPDTVYLAETMVYPWPTKDQFREAFLNLDIPDDDLERAKDNLEREALAEAGLTLPYDGNEAADLYLRGEAKKFYYAGQKPPQNIFNPIAWAQFIQAWKDGAFKSDKKKEKGQ